MKHLPLRPESDMGNRNLIRVLLASILALGCSITGGQAQMPPYEPLKLPSGRPFPASRAALLKIRNHPDGRAIREMRTHAWDVFAGLTVGEQPIWNTWSTMCDVRLAGCAPNPPGANFNRRRLFENFEVPTQSLSQLERMEPMSAGQPLQNSQPLSAVLGSSDRLKLLAGFVTDYRAAPQLASVLFDREAADHILNNCLFHPNQNPAASRVMACPPSPKGKIAPFPRRAVVLKTVWGVVPQKGGLLKIWKPELWNEIHSANFNLERSWRKLKVDTEHDLLCDKDEYGDEEVVPLRCFYTFQVMPGDAFSNPLAHIVNGAIPPGSFLVLLGIHVTTKETPDWVWATFWWDNHGTSDWHAQGRPRTIGTPWNHFLMDTTLSGMTPVEEDGGPKICFNPFLETDSGIENGVISNCLQCHSKAAYGSDPRIAYKLGVLGRDGKTLASPVQPMPNNFDKLVKTDFLWSLVSARDPRLQEVLNDLQFAAQTIP